MELQKGTGVIAIAQLEEHIVKTIQTPRAQRKFIKEK